MKKRSILAILTLLVLLLGIALVPASAQDEEGSPLTFDLPEGYESIEVISDIDPNNARLEMGDEIIIILGPDNYATVISGQEFEDDISALIFFMDRTGYSAGTEAVDASYDNVLAAIRISLPRRQQQGLAYLVDLGVGLRGIVVSLHTGRGRVGAPGGDVDTVLNSVKFNLDIVDAAATEGSFTILVEAIQAAGLEDTLRGEGPFTVFAPNDAAFEALLFSFGLSKEQLLAADYLDEILLYHVVSGAVNSGDLAENYLDQNSIPTLLPANNIFAFTGIDGLLYLNNAQSEIVATDIEASNGVIHVVDGVLLPQCAIDSINGSGSCD
jgi:uncharacterized surface protein with fasciclin (FAS1) repeats